MSTPVNFVVTAGLPFSRQVRITNGKSLWATEELFEARMQIRDGEDVSTALRYDFTPHLQKSYDGEDILVRWDLTGAQTRALKSGFYDLIVSDVGPEDAKALPPLLYGRFKVETLVTSAEGAS